MALAKSSTSCTCTTRFRTPRRPTWPARCCGRAAKLTVITTLHGTDITLVGQELGFFEITRFSIEQSDLVTAVSAYLRDETYRAFGASSAT